jgi:hypothetical protein
MTEISRDQAVQRLRQQVASMAADDLAETYNELFPSQPTTEAEARQSRSRRVDGIIEHISRGLEVEEIEGLWNVVFPKDRNVYYDEETNVLHDDEEAESVHSADYPRRGEN